MRNKFGYNGKIEKSFPIKIKWNLVRLGDLEDRKYRYFPQFECEFVFDMIS